MNAPQRLHALGQSLWLDNLTRDMLDDGTLARYIRELAVTGLTSNPTIFEKAIASSAAYEMRIRDLARSGIVGEALFFELALDDVRRAADLFRPIHQRTAGVDGFVSLEVSPLLARDGARTLAEAERLHARAARPNVFIKIPGTHEGLSAIEEAIFRGVPINVTLLFSAEQYLAAAESFMRGIERRIDAGLEPDVACVASLFVSRWDAAVAPVASVELHNRLGIAMAYRAYQRYRKILVSERWQRLSNNGARPQRLLFASTGTKDPRAPQSLYVRALAAPLTVNTIPESTLLAIAGEADIDATIPADGGDCEAVIAQFVAAAIDIDALAARLQAEGADAFVRSWNTLLGVIERKAKQLIDA